MLIKPTDTVMEAVKAQMKSTTPSPAKIGTEWLKTQDDVDIFYGENPGSETAAGAVVMVATPVVALVVAATVKGKSTMTQGLCSIGESSLQDTGGSVTRLLAARKEYIV